MTTQSRLLRETPGASWEKRGNTLWLLCAKEGCATWFPVSPSLSRVGAAAACCPRCHFEMNLSGE